MEFKRSSGILLHPVSLPSPFGIGDLGSEAYNFVDFLVRTKQSLWQILPLGPTGYGNCPYSCSSAFAGNPMLISPELLVKEGFLDKEDLENVPEFSKDKIDYEKVIEFKTNLLKKSFEKFKENVSKKQEEEFNSFCAENHSWLHDFAVFMSVKEHYANEAKKQGVKNERESWSDWEEELVKRYPKALDEVCETFKDDILYHKYLQHQFFKQWLDLRLYANKNNILLVGDIPIFVTYDSSDVWQNPEIFQLDEKRRPTSVAGVPPDYFSETGQLWGNPLYNWDKLLERNFDWWIERFKMTFAIVDIVRVDHFRGFESYWAIPAGAKNAVHGRWLKAYGDELFEVCQRTFDYLPVIAEDLGVITPEVEYLRDKYDFPGMKILQFAFSDNLSNPFLPHNYRNRNCLTYTGTHDNDTTLGWYRNSSKADEREFALQYLNRVGIRATGDNNITWSLMALGAMSDANIAIYPLQDVFNLDSDARMNIPSTTEHNWEWRYTPDMITEEIEKDLRDLTVYNNR